MRDDMYTIYLLVPYLKAVVHMRHSLRDGAEADDINVIREILDDIRVGDATTRLDEGVRELFLQVRSRRLQFVGREVIQHGHVSSCLDGLLRFLLALTFHFYFHREATNRAC